MQKARVQVSPGRLLACLALGFGLASLVAPVAAEVPWVPARKPASAVDKARAVAFVDALERYGALESAHASDPPASRWDIWPGRGYRLNAVPASDLALVALRGEKPGDMSYVVTRDPGPAGCAGQSRGDEQSFTLDGRRMPFTGSCLDAQEVYRPVHASDVAWIRLRMDKGGQLGVETNGQAATFDLSRVPVIKMRFVVEAAGAAARTPQE
jgi:hypothetical protein